MKKFSMFELTNDLILPESDFVAELYRVQKFMDKVVEAGNEIHRFNLIENPIAFLGDPVAADLMESEGDGAFPLLMADGIILKKGSYPTVEEWSTWAELPGLAEQIKFDDKELATFRLRFMQASSSCGSCSGCSGCSSGCGSAEDDLFSIADDLADFDE